MDAATTIVISRIFERLQADPRTTSIAEPLRALHESGRWSPEAVQEAAESPNESSDAE
jgi:hypothetical protein